MHRSSIGLRIAACDVIRAEQMRRDVPLLDRLRDGWPIMTWMTDYNTLWMAECNVNVDNVDGRLRDGWPITRWPLTTLDAMLDDLRMQ